MNYLKEKSEVVRDFEQNLSKISPFELKNRLINLADESVRKMAHTMLNAGRGNPNWIATVPREAFFVLGEFGLSECRRTFDLPEGFAGLPQKTGIAQRFERFLKNKLEKNQTYECKTKQCENVTKANEAKTYLSGSASEIMNDKKKEKTDVKIKEKGINEGVNNIGNKEETNITIPMCGATFLTKAYEYMLMEHAADPDELIHEWTEAVIGDQYPVPDRILKYTEVVVRDYLKQELFGQSAENLKTHETAKEQSNEGNKQFKSVTHITDSSTINRDISDFSERVSSSAGEMKLFAVEGGTAAMCYIFDSLMQNYLLRRGDSVALLVPAFTPYIEIPELKRYDFDVLHIHANRMTKDGMHLWQYDEKDINRLRDTKYKALFVINPSNPPSYALSHETVAQLRDIVERWNPHLMVVTDDVYATYVRGFRSLMADLPRNTLCVYSFSKYFGATGWRTAVIAINEDNVYDELLRALPRKRKSDLTQRYSSLTTTPETMAFIDRMVADSRQVGLNHTAGLSLPQQMQMSLFALFSLLDHTNSYRKRMLDLIDRRLRALWDSSGFTLLPDPLRAGYYSEIDMLVWATKFYGNDFVDYLKRTYNPLDVVFRLATETGLVVLNGGGFDGPEWSVRVSLANLNEEDYVRIGHSLRDILTSYAEEWKGNNCC